MATQTQTAPEITILNRVYSIPLIGSSIDSINSTLASNSYTCTPYSTAKGLSVSAYKLSEPLQVRIAPLIVRADGYANKAVDVVESRYPYPFKAKPEEVANYVRERRESSEKYMKERRESAIKTIDDNVKSPALTYAQAIDQRFTPFVDYFEVTVTKLNGQVTPPKDTKYQYQRALALSKSITNNLFSPEQYATVQRLTDTAQSITNLASSTFQSAQVRVQELSNKMLSDLRTLQTSVSSEYGDLHATLQKITTELGTTLKSDLPLNEKLAKVTEDVKETVSPFLVELRTRVVGFVDVLAKKGQEVIQRKQEGEQTTNWNGTRNENGKAD